MHPGASPVVVGIIGDPNCGKSVFSLALNHYRGTIGCRGWRLDGDGASPTPDWYLSSQAATPQAVDNARENIKRAWSEDMENRIAERIRRLRLFFEVAIADLPGGDHRQTPPRRVPPHREVMMREVDVFVLIQRADKPSESAWREALAPHGLDGRIAVVLCSQAPEGPPALEVSTDRDGTWRGAIRGLDRKKKPEELVSAFRSGFDTLWPVLLRHSRST